MPVQVIQLPRVAPSSIGLFWRRQLLQFSDENRQIDSNFLDGSGPAYLSRFEVRLDSHLVFRTRATTVIDTVGGFDIGPDLSDAWERSDTALTISIAGQSYVFAGPAHPDNERSDTSEPYAWRTTATALQQVYDAYVAASSFERSQATLQLAFPDNRNLYAGLAGTMNGALDADLAYQRNDIDVTIRASSPRRRIVTCLEINHPDSPGGKIRVVNDTDDLVIGGETFFCDAV